MAVFKQHRLTGGSLKQMLWDTIHEVKSKQIDPAVANATSSLARQVISVVKTEMQIVNMQKRAGGKGKAAPRKAISFSPKSED